MFENIDFQLSKAIQLLIKNYNRAKQNPIVENPTLYSMYYTWEYLDKQAKEKKNERNRDNR